ncbi:hypothetical protein ACWIUD_00930 [Helicobacter sp. 23-1044]
MCYDCCSRFAPKFAKYSARFAESHIKTAQNDHLGEKFRGDWQG